MQKDMPKKMSPIMTTINRLFLFVFFAILAVPHVSQAEAPPPGGGGGGQGGTGAEPEQWMLLVVMLTVLSLGLFFKQKRLSKNA